MRSFSRWAAAAVMASMVLMGCSVEPPAHTVTPGQRTFLTVEPDTSPYDAWSTVDGQAGSAERADSAAPAANAGTSSAAGPSAPSGREGTVEEADIYRIDGNRLFTLNTYRGFIAYDLTDPKNPVRVSRLPIYGYPIEMFVANNTVYALVRDALYVTQTEADGLRFQKHNVSQLITVDIADVKNPRILKTVDIVGELREGVSRKIDNTIYVVSYLPQSYYYRGYPYGAERTEQAWVYSFNVADPKDPLLVEKLKIFEGGGSNVNTSSAWSSRSFAGITISATSNTLHVVENWQTSESSNTGGCGYSYTYEQDAKVTIVDISDPSGDIRTHATFSTKGALTDQFKQTYVFNETTKKGYYLGIFARQEWVGTGCGGGSRVVKNTIESWDVTDGANPVRVSSLQFGKPNETVRGSTFDTENQIAYAITAVRTDPLYAISYADPANLTILSSIEGLSGDMNVFRLIEGGKFLLAIGQDNTETCTGFQQGNGWRSANVAVSIIDVQNPRAIRLVERRCVAVENAEWVTSQVNWNLDQAHKLIGLHSDSRASVVSVPVNYYAKADASGIWWWYRPESAVGLMSFNVKAYDPTKDHLNQVVLKNHATVVNAHGAVERTVVFTHSNGRRMMVNLSDTHVAVVDIDDLDHPVQQSEIEMAPYHSRVYRFGDYVVDEVQTGAASYGYYGYGTGASEFRVKRVQPGLDEAPTLASLTVARVERVFQYKNFLVVFRTIPTGTDGALPSQSEAVVVSFEDPTKPVIVGQAALPLQRTSGYWFCCVGWYYGGWGWTNEAVVTDLGVAMLAPRTSYASNLYSTEMVLTVLDLTIPSAPVVRSKTLSQTSYDYQARKTTMTSQREYLSLFGDAHGLLVGTREKISSYTTVNGSRFADYRYYVEAFDQSTLESKSATNIPGRVVQRYIANGAERLLVTDNTYTLQKMTEPYTYEWWQAGSRVHLLDRVSADVAVLADTRDFGARQLMNMAGDQRRLFMTLSVPYNYSASARSVGETVERGDDLVIIDLSGGKLVQRFAGDVGTYGAQLMGVYEDRLFASLPGMGVMAIDVSDLSKPSGQHFVRTLGWATHLTFTDSRGYIASGNFGIYEIDLAGPATIARF